MRSGGSLVVAPRVKISSLADHRPRRLNQRHLHLEGAGAEPYRPALGQDLQTDERHHRGRGRRGEPRAIIVIYIFEENHRFSKKTPHPGPDSVVCAADLAAGRRTAGRGRSRTDFRSL